MPNFNSNTVQVHIAMFNPEYDCFKFLVLKRSADEIVYPNIWQVITGTIEPDETAIETALREVIEETGFTPLRFWALPCMTNYYSWKKDTVNFSPVFGMIVNYDAEITLSEEHQAYEWLYLDACLDRLLLPSHKSGTQVFFDTILNQSDNTMFEINFKNLK